MGRTIDQWTWDYYLVQRYANMNYWFYFKKIYVNNLSNLPRNESVILAPNHQNALIDALALVYSAKCQPIFLARADIFKGRLLIHFLNFLNIAPIYRMRDGASNVRKNEEVFANTLAVLKNKYNPLCLFAEGTHGDKRRLRPLKKGIFRIAFMAQEEFKNNPGVKIAPVGLEYSHYQNYRSTLLINYGKPVEVSEYYELYAEDNNQGINQLREKLDKEMRELMIDIQTEEFYDLYQNLRTVYNADMRKKLNISSNTILDKFNADKKMISILDDHRNKNPEDINSLSQKMKRYVDGLEKLNLRDWVICKDKFPLLLRVLEALVLIILSPIHILGLINNYIPYKIPERFTKKVKDRQFYSSFKLVLGMITFPLYYIILMILALIFIDSLWIKLSYLIAIPFSGLFAFRYYIRWKKLSARFRYARLKRNRESSIKQLIVLRKDITDSMNKIVEQKIN